MERLLLIIACTALAGFYGGAETGAYRLNRIRLRRLSVAGSRLARLLRGVVADMESFVCMTLAAQNIAVYGATAFCTALLAGLFRHGFAAELTSTLLLAPVLLVFAEVIPKSVFQSRPDKLMCAAAPLLWVSGKVLVPVVVILRGVVAFWRLVLGGKTEAGHTLAASHDLFLLMAAGREEGVITQQQHAMVTNIMDMGKRPVRKAMIPLQRVGMIPADAADGEALDLIRRHDHARLPVYSGSRENIVGVLVTIDYLCGEYRGPVREAMRRPLILRLDTPAYEAFERLRSAGESMAVVADSSGRAVGIVTIGDLLQEMVG